MKYRITIEIETREDLDQDKRLKLLDSARLQVLCASWFYDTGTELVSAEIAHTYAGDDFEEEWPPNVPH